MSASRGNYIAADARRRRSSSARRCGSPTSCSSSGTGWSWSGRRPDGDPLEAKLALARFIVTRSHGEEAAGAAEAHFTRVVREGQAPEEVPEAPLPDGDPVHLPALLADAFGLALDERGAPADRARAASKVDGEVVTELDLPRERLDRMRVLQAGKRRFVRLTTRT